MFRLVQNERAAQKKKITQIWGLTVNSIIYLDIDKSRKTATKDQQGAEKLPLHFFWNLKAWLKGLSAKISELTSGLVECWHTHCRGDDQKDRLIRGATFSLLFSGLHLMSGELRSISWRKSREKMFFPSVSRLTDTSRRGRGLPESRCRTCCWFGSGWGCWSGRWVASPEAAEQEQVDPTGGPTENSFFHHHSEFSFPWTWGRIPDVQLAKWSYHITTTSFLCQFTRFYHWWSHLEPVKSWKWEPTSSTCNISFR